MASAEQPHPLDVVLADRGLSLAELAVLCRAAVAERGLRSGIDRNLVWKWKTGRRTPNVESQQCLAEALGVPPSVVSEAPWPSWLWRAVASPQFVLRPPWSLTGTMRVLKEVTLGTMDRREFLVITGATLTGLATQWSSAVSASAASPPSVGSAVDRLTPELLDRLSNRLADLRYLDDEYGGRELHHLAVAEFRWLSQLADSGSYDSEGGRRLFGLITEAARLCGWSHFDAAHHAAAQTYYVAALRSSASAEDPLNGAHVLACMSFQSALAGHHQEAVNLIESAQERVGRYAPPRLSALLASRQARAHACAGEAAACGHALNQAERYLGSAGDSVDEPDWIYYFDHAELAAQAGACWVDLRQPTRARPLLDDALTTLNPRCVRDRAVYHARSARAYLHDNEIDQACMELSKAADLAGQTGSAHAVSHVRQVRSGMSSHEQEPSVRTLDRQLAELVA